MNVSTEHTGWKSGPKNEVVAVAVEHASRPAMRCPHLGAYTQPTSEIVGLAIREPYCILISV